MAEFGEIVEASRGLEHRAAWRDLADRAEPNPFGEYAFVSAALKHFGPLPIALLWADPRREKLLAVAVVKPPRLGLRLVRIWRHEQAALPALLVDVQATAGALRALVACVRARWPLCAGLLAPRVRIAGPLGEAALSTEPVVILSRFHRASATPADPPPSPKRRKEWARLERRLAERGRLRRAVVRDMAGFEGFLALEAAGWKAARGTALRQRGQNAGFARDLAAAFLGDGQLEIHELRVDDRLIAAGVILRSGGWAFFWKTAYDETLASFSPGVLLAHGLAAGMLASSGLEGIDSCAAPDHPMIDHVWRGRLELADIVLGVSGFSAPWLRGERTATGLRELAKRIVIRATGRKRS